MLYKYVSLLRHHPWSRWLVFQRHDDHSMHFACARACARTALCALQVFDLSSRIILRTFRNHTGPVQVTRFCEDGTRLMTASDDRTVRRLDISSEAELNRFVGHRDHVRCGVLNPTSETTFITGSYKALAAAQFVGLLRARCRTLIILVCTGEAHTINQSIN